MRKVVPRAEHGQHVLVVADDPNQAGWLNRFLQRQGYRCSLATAGQEPLALIRDCRPDVVLCDGGGPASHRLCAAIKADPELRWLPVLLADDFAEPSDVVQALQSGVDHLVFKPFDERYLRARLAFVQANRPLLDAEKPRSGVGVRIADGTAFIAADRRQVLNLLFSAVEAAVEKQRLLKAVCAERDQLRAELSALQAQPAGASRRLAEAAAPYLDIAPPARAPTAPATAAAAPEQQERLRLVAMLDARLRPPLHELVAASEHLAHEPARSPSSALATVRDNAALLLGLLDELGQDGQANGVDPTGNHTPVPLTALVEDLCTSLLPRAARHGINLTVFVSPALPPRLLADELRLRQLLRQLIDNAIGSCADLAARRGRVSVRAEIDADGDTPLLSLRIADNGAGIASATLDALLHAPASDLAERNDSGLSTCLRLARRMGGELRAASVAGAGSVFTLRLPLIAAASPPLSPHQDVSTVDCILVAHPELATDDLRTYLQHAGVRVQQFAELADAEQAAALRAQPLVMIRHFDGKRPDPAVMRQALVSAPLVRHLLITRGRRRHARLESENCVTLDGDALSRDALLHAVALAIGGPATPSAPISIDLDVLRRQFGNHPTAARERLADFYIATRHQLDALRTALSADDLAQAVRIGDRMRDACQAVGAQTLGLECAALADTARRENAPATRQHLPALERALFAVEREIATLLTSETRPSNAGASDSGLSEAGASPP